MLHINAFQSILYTHPELGFFYSQCKTYLQCCIIGLLWINVLFICAPHAKLRAKVRKFSEKCKDLMKIRLKKSNYIVDFMSKREEADRLTADSMTDDSSFYIYHTRAWVCIF